MHLPLILIGDAGGVEKSMKLFEDLRTPFFERTSLAFLGNKPQLLNATLQLVIVLATVQASIIAITCANLRIDDTLCSCFESNS